MSVEALGWVFQHSESRLGARHVLLSIANHAKSDGTGAWPSVDTIARESKLSVREVQYCLVILVRSGELRVSQGQGPHGCNLYTLPGVQSLRNGTIGRGAVSGSTVTQNPAKNVSKIAPEPKSIEPSLKATVKEPTLINESDEKKKQRHAIQDRSRLRYLVRMLRENPGLVPAEKARIQLMIDDLKRKLAA